MIPGEASTLFPVLLRHWRSRRGLSQLDLSNVAGVSSRHVSFLETGRSSPSAAMVLRLCSALDVPLRQRNTMMRSAGHPPWFREPDAEESVTSRLAWVFDLMKRNHEPYPLLVVDAAYRVLDANEATWHLLRHVLPDGPDLGTPPDLARFILLDPHARTLLDNHAEVARECLWRLHRDLMADSGNDAVRLLLEDATTEGAVRELLEAHDMTAPVSPALELRLRTPSGPWRFVATMTTLQSPLEVGLEDVRIESWYPVDEPTRRGCLDLAGG